MSCREWLADCGILSSIIMFAVFYVCRDCFIVGVTLRTSRENYISLLIISFLDHMSATFSSQMFDEVCNWLPFVTILRNSEIIILPILMTNIKIIDRNFLI